VTSYRELTICRVHSAPQVYSKCTANDSHEFCVCRGLAGNKMQMHCDFRGLRSSWQDFSDLRYSSATAELLGS